MKLYAYIDNGSASVLASLIDSIVDAGASVITLMAIRVSLMPADADHRSGHGKAEGLAALFQAAFIAAAGFFLLLESISRFGTFGPPADQGAALIIMTVSIFISLILIGIQQYSLKFAPSLAVESDKAHYGTDILVNIGVIGVLMGQRAGMPLWLDPVFAVAVVIY